MAWRAICRLPTFHLPLPIFEFRLLAHGLALRDEWITWHVDIDAPSHDAGNVTVGAGRNANRAGALLSPRCGLVPDLKWHHHITFLYSTGMSSLLDGVAFFNGHVLLHVANASRKCVFCLATHTFFRLPSHRDLHLHTESTPLILILILAIRL